MIKLKVTKSILAAAALVIAAGFTAKAITKEQVNNKVAALLASYNNATTSAKVEFTDLTVDAIRALDFGVLGHFQKSGPENKIQLDLSPIQYAFGDGLNPSFSGQANLKMNFVTYLGQDGFNQFGKELAEFMAEMAEDLGEKYGDALLMDSAVDEIITDANGNIVSLKAHLNAAIDFNNLPLDLPSEKVEIKNLKLVISATTANAQVQANVVMNPLYAGFKTDEVGLKEYIEKLLDEDPETYATLQDVVGFVDEIANDIVNTKSKK